MRSHEWVTSSSVHCHAGLGAFVFVLHCGHTFLLPTYLSRPIRIIINLGPSYGLRSEHEAHRTPFCGHISVAAATGAPRFMGDSKGKFAFDKEQLERRMWLGGVVSGSSRSLIG